MAAWAVGAFLGSGVAVALMNRLGRRILHIGLALMGAGIAGAYLVLARGGSGFDSWHLALPLLLFGLGMGMIFVPLFDIIMGEVSNKEVGSASSTLEALQQLGASLGVAVLGTIYVSAGVTVVTLLALALTGLAFGLGFLLPRKARAH